MSVLTNDLDSAVTPMVDDYRSAVLEQLNVMEVVATSPIGPSTSPKAKRFIGPTKGKGARTQANVQIPVGSKEASTSGKSIKNGGRQSDAKAERPGPSTRGHRGRRTGGKPRGTKTLVLSGCTRYCGVRKHQQENERLSGLLSNLPTRASGAYFVLKEKLESSFIRKTL